MHAIIRTRDRQAVKPHQKSAARGLTFTLFMDICYAALLSLHSSLLSLSVCREVIIIFTLQGGETTVNTESLTVLNYTKELVTNPTYT